MVRDVGGIPVGNEAAIIPFKAHAWLDLTRERGAGSKVDEKTLEEHRNDVARLLQILTPETTHALPDPVAEDMRSFVEMAKEETDYDLKQFKVNITREKVVDRLRAIYQL